MFFIFIKTYPLFAIINEFQKYMILDNNQQFNVTIEQAPNKP